MYSTKIEESLKKCINFDKLKLSEVQEGKWLKRPQRPLEPSQAIIVLLHFIFQNGNAGNSYFIGATYEADENNFIYSDSNESSRYLQSTIQTNQPGTTCAIWWHIGKNLHAEDCSMNFMSLCEKRTIPIFYGNYL